MKKLTVLALALLLGMTIAACEREEAEEAVMFDEDAEEFEIEDGAEIEIGVDSVTLGQALVEQWEEEYPEHEDVLSYTFYDAVNDEDGGMEGLELMEDEAPDVALVIDNEVLGREPAVRELHDYFIDIGEEQTHEIYEDINELGNFYLPAVYDGMVFSWNKTMLEEWDVDVDDRTEGNLPAEFASWEDIFDYADEYGKEPGERPEFEGDEILEFFPLSVAEAWSGYMQLSATGWNIFEGEDYGDPEFDDPQFLEGLEFLEAFSEANMSVDSGGEPRSAGAMAWRWENYLEGDYPFGLVGTWMDIDGYMEDTGYEFEFAYLPTWEGNDPSTLYKTKGFVINSYTDYPSAANEVMRWLYSEDTMGTIVNESAYIPALQEDAEITPEVEQDYKEDMINAIEHNGWLESADRVPGNPTQRAMSVYYDIGVEAYMEELWDGDRTPEETQDDIVDDAEYWMDQRRGD